MTISMDKVSAPQRNALTNTKNAINTNTVVITGDEGNNILQSYAPNVIFTGGKGNDIVYSSSGDNTYVYEPGDGNDVISMANSKSNHIIFQNMQLINISSIQYKNADLVIAYGEGDSITIKSHLINQKNFTFSVGDESNIDLKTLKTMVLAIHSGSYGESIESLGKQIIGSDNSEKLYGSPFQDNVFYSGKGNDTMVAGIRGHNTFIIKKQDGHDLIQASLSSNNIYFKDMKFADILSVSQNKTDLVIQYSETDSVTIQRFFAASSFSSFAFSFKDIQQISFEKLLENVPVKQLSSIDSGIYRQQSYNLALKDNNSVMSVDSGSADMTRMVNHQSLNLVESMAGFGVESAVESNFNEGASHHLESLITASGM